MKREEEIRYWARIAKDDIRVARHLLDAGDRLHAMFFCHLAVEKMLKALFVKNPDRLHRPLIIFPDLPWNPRLPCRKRTWSFSTNY